MSQQQQYESIRLIHNIRYFKFRAYQRTKQYDIIIFCSEGLTRIDRVTWTVTYGYDIRKIQNCMKACWVT